MGDTEAMPKIVVAATPRKSATELADAYNQGRRRRQLSQGLTVFALGVLGLIVFAICVIMLVSHKQAPGIMLLALGAGSLVAIIRGLTQAAASGNHVRVATRPTQKSRG